LVRCQSERTFNGSCPLDSIIAHRVTVISPRSSRTFTTLEEMTKADDRASIFARFAEMGSILRRHLEETFGREVLCLHGQVPKAQRDRMVDRFQSYGGHQPRLVVLSFKAGGTGLNLTAANHVFHFDRWWDPAIEDQATDRAFRIGQKQNIQVHKFICVGTLEGKIGETIESKRPIAGSFVGTGEDWLTKLFTAGLEDLLTLRDETFGRIDTPEISSVLLNKAESGIVSSIFQRSRSNDARPAPRVDSD
jgi:SNF2 family DNA or RNA helicase